MTQNDALDRIMLRQKPKVPSRSDVVKESMSLDVMSSVSQDLENPSTQDPFETVRNTIRIESNVDEGLRQICHSERITKETFLEASYLFLQEHPEQLAKVVSIAQERLQQRKEIANYQRAKTMQRRFLKS